MVKMTVTSEIIKTKAELSVYALVFASFLEKGC